MDKEVYDKIRSHVCGPFDAVKARSLTNVNKDTLVITCLNSIYVLIDHRAKYGYDTAVWDSNIVDKQYDVYVTVATLNKVKDFLTEDGYTVNVDGPYLRINW